jgi:hypothetical protein
MARISMTISGLLDMTDKQVINLTVQFGPLGQKFRIVELTDTGVLASPLEVNADWEDPNVSRVTIPGSAIIVIDDDNNL